MYISLNDFLDFVIVWIKKRTEVHLGELVIYPTMVRHCFCCHGDGNYANATNGLCRKCCVERECAMCRETFEPSLESVGVFCPKCWDELEATWTTTFNDVDPVRAETVVRSLVTKAAPCLTGCRHNP